MRHNLNRMSEWQLPQTRLELELEARPSAQTGGLPGACHDEREVLVPLSSTESRAAFRVSYCVLIRAGRQGWAQGVPREPNDLTVT